jgi:hypothetical protein
MVRRRERWSRRKQVYPFLLPPVRQRFAPPRPPSSEPERRAFEAGKRAAGGGHDEPPTGPSLSERAAYDRGHRLASGSDDLRAPVSWPVEAVFLALEAAAAETEADPDPHRPIHRALSGVPSLLTGWVLERAKADFERERARTLGLTPETTPQISPTSWVYGLAAMFVQGAYLTITRRRVRQPPWPRALATGVIREFERRQAWKRARAQASGPPRP